jgi:hypothetical protein
MDADLSKYDLEHVVTDHPKMSRAEWQAIYQEAWHLYYSHAHVETLMRRAAASGIPMTSFVKVLVPFMTMVPLEGVHPLQAGLFRLKHPSERRPGLPRERALPFYLRFVGNLVAKNLALARTILWIWRTKRRIERDPARRSYTDLALAAVPDEGLGSLDLFTKTSGAREAIEHQRKVAQLTGSTAA